MPLPSLNKVRAALHMALSNQFKQWQLERMNWPAFMADPLPSGEGTAVYLTDALFYLSIKDGKWDGNYAVPTAFNACLKRLLDFPPQLQHLRVLAFYLKQDPVSKDRVREWFEQFFPP